MINLINCRELLADNAIEDIKNTINTYHQGFMVIDNELYIPYYSALKIGLMIPNDCDRYLLSDYSTVTAKDTVASAFGMCDNVDEVTIIDLSDAVYRQDLGQAVNILSDTLCDMLEPTD